MAKKNSWSAEFGRAFKKLDDLYDFLNWEVPEGGIKSVAQTYPLFVPYRLAEKIKLQGPEGVLAREFLPHQLEVAESLNKWGEEDPIGDQKYNRAPQLIHRYPSRVLFAPTSVCPVHCRYCFRKNELNQSHELFAADFEKTLAYLQEHKEISEIIFTGGDPFTLSDQRLDFYLQSFAKIKHIKDIRFHTRYPVIMPERFNEELLLILEKHAHSFRTFSIAIHANHVDEFDEEAKTTIQQLGQLPLQLLSQSVLLKGINDSAEALTNLINLFLELKIRPYYLHHPDRVKGGMHFYLPLETGRMLYAQLRRHLPGWALPQYMVDLPQGAGKISAFNPETFSFSGTFLALSGDAVALEEPQI